MATVDQEEEAVKHPEVTGFHQGTALGKEEDGPVSCRPEVVIWEPQSGQKWKLGSELQVRNTGL